MHSNGIQPLESIIADGKWHRSRLPGDKGNKRSLAYKLSIFVDNSYGHYCDHRIGETLTFSAKEKTDIKLTPDEVNQRRLENEERKNRYAAEIETARNNAAEKAARKWKIGEKDKTTPYLQRKRIPLMMGRVDGDKVIVPLVEESKIINLQTIDAAGDKRFLFGGKKQGCFCPIYQDAPKERIILCEGYATGVTLHIITKLPVVVCFDAGNIIYVARKIRARYPESELIFCADNDQWRENGNIGIESATTALNEVGGRGLIKAPPFEVEHPDRPTDWNDYYVLYGVDATRDALGLNKSVIVNHEPDNYMPVTYEPDQDWRLQTMWKSEPLGIPNKSLNNLVVALKYRPGFCGLYAFNEFSHEIIVHKCPPWEDKTRFTPHRVHDTDITGLMVALERAGYLPNFDLVNRAVDEAARKNPINPARDYFNGLKWDGVNRLDNWLVTYCGVQEPLEYVQGVGSKWLCSAVARVFSPGCQVDHMLVLEGKQGAYKSSLLRELATFNGETYFSDAVTIDKIDDKDTIGKLQGRLIVEFAELSGLGKKDIGSIKRWLTMRQDEGRLAYERHNKIFKRQFVPAATNNPIMGWMDDPTGNRRFWPVTVGRIDMDSVRRDKEHLWAEAVYRYKKGEQLHLTLEQESLADEVRMGRTISDIWEPEIEYQYAGRHQITTQEIAAFLGIEKQKQDKQLSQRIGRIMKKLGYTNAPVYLNGRTQTGWVLDVT